MTDPFLVIENEDAYAAALFFGMFCAGLGFLMIVSLVCKFSWWVIKCLWREATRGEE
jgi:hypothetical protein